MRTTINLDEDILKQAKLLARQSGMTLTAVIEDALRERIARRQGTASQAPVHLPTVAGHGLLPGVDLDNSSALRELMDAAP